LLPKRICLDAMVNGSDFIVFAFNARITIQGIVGVRPDDTAGNSRTCHKGSNLDQSHTLEVSQQMIQ
jgi:hypothetical protein